MADMEPTARRYTDREVGAILKRAVELVADGSNHGPDGSVPQGTTLDQLQQAAIELGIDPALIAQAATEVGDDAGRTSWLSGGPWSVESDHIIEGTVTEEDWASLVEDMRAFTGRVGTPKIVGKAYEWLSGQPDPLHVSITPHGSGTRVRVTARFGDLPGLGYTMLPGLGLLLSALFSLAMTKSGIFNAVEALSLIVGVPLSAMLCTRFAAGPFAVRKRRKTRELISMIERRIAGSTRQTATSAQIGTLPYRAAVDPASQTEQVNGESLQARLV